MAIASSGDVIGAVTGHRDVQVHEAGFRCENAAIVALGYTAIRYHEIDELGFALGVKVAAMDRLDSIARKFGTTCHK
jgi:hypothetical protein